MTKRLTEAEAIKRVREQEAGELSNLRWQSEHAVCEIDGEHYILPLAALDGVAPALPQAAAERAERDVYTSENRPPDIRSRDRFHRICREMAAAKIPGVDRVGRQWRVTASAWRSFRAGGAGTAVDPDAVARMVAKLR